MMCEQQKPEPLGLDIFYSLRRTGALTSERAVETKRISREHRQEWAGGERYTTSCEGTEVCAVAWDKKYLRDNAFKLKN